MVRTKPRGYVSLASLSFPGFYTVILLSATWCEPCHVAWSEARSWLRAYPNVVLVDVDVTDAAVDGRWVGPEIAVLRSLDVKGNLPVAVQIGPFGELMRAESGLDGVRRLASDLARRRYATALPMPATPMAVQVPRCDQEK